ncbi:hypothetical protein BAE44_0020591, partial [Dichanthelium oligosanthes]
MSKVNASLAAGEFASGVSGSRPSMTITFPPSGRAFQQFFSIVMHCSSDCKSTIHCTCKRTASPDGTLSY